MSIALTETKETPTVQTPHPKALGRNYLNYPTGAVSWMFTLDHKRIAVMYLIAILGCLLLGGIYGGLLRAELWNPSKSLLDAEAYHRAFSNHGLFMVLLVLLPAIPAVIGNFILPLMLGAKALAFPRLSLFGLYLYGLAALLFVNSINVGSVGAGWPFSMSLAGPSAGSVSMIFLGTMFAGASCLLNSLNIIASIQYMRAPGMTWKNMPLFLWAMYASSAMHLAAIPILSVASLLVLSERALEMGLFQRDLGGDDGLYTHLIWFFAHASVYIMILPAMGVVCEVLSVHSRKRILGYRMVAWSMVAIAVCSPFAWGSSMSFKGQSDIFNTIFSLLSFLVAVPMATIVFSWLATLYRGSIAWNTPMLYALMFLLILAIGGLSGLFLNALATQVLLHDTSFATAHMHYLWGSVVVGFIAALHHWWPKITGRMYNDRHGVLCAWLVFAGFNMAFFPQFLAGSRGLPRRLAVYPAQFEIYQQISTCGACILAIALLGLVFYLLQSFFQGERASSDPWDGASLEWRCSSPPTWDNLPQVPQ